MEALFSQAGLATQSLVGAGSTYLLFDAGDGTLRDLLKRGVPPKKSLLESSSARAAFPWVAYHPSSLPSGATSRH